jgi:hypothetical protein
VEDDPAVSALEDPLEGANLPSRLPVRGQLAFYYPDAEIHEAKRAYLVVKELDEPFGTTRSQALIRLRP